MYKSIVEAVLLFGAETWVLSKAMETKLQSFHRRCVRALTGQYLTKNPDGTWTCPSSEETLKEAGICTIQESIRKRQDAAKLYARSLPIYKKCEASHPLAGNGNQRVLWETQDGTSLVLLRTAPKKPGNGSGSQISGDIRNFVFCGHKKR